MRILSWAGAVSAMLKILAVAAAVIASFSAACAQKSRPDCSQFQRSADGSRWKLNAPIDWPPYVKMTTGYTIVGRHGMFVNGENFFDVIEKACGKH
jgi:hypothetical protein